MSRWSGFKRDRGNAYRLHQKDVIQQRIKELLAERDKMHVRATEKAVKVLAIDREWVMARLIEQHAKAAAIPGVPAAVTAALRAWELLGREIGMFIERQHGAPGDFERMSDDELRQLALRAIREPGDLGDAKLN